MHLRTLSLLPLLLLSCDQGCTDADGNIPIFVPDFEWHGENVTVYGYGYSEADLCAGSLTALDQRIALVEGFFNLDSTPHYEFGWMAPDVWDQTACADVGGCAGGHKAWSPRLPDMHESTHVIIDAFECPPILEEGLAEFLDDSSYSRRVLIKDLHVEDLIENGYQLSGPGAYARATHFTSYLLQTYGPEAVFQLCRAIPRDDSLADWHAAVPEILELSFEDLLWFYNTEYPPCTSHQMRARLWGCAGTPDFVLASDDPQHSEYRLEASCSDSRTTNATTPGLGGAATTRLIHVISDEYLTLDAHAEGPSGTPARFTLQRCASCFEGPLAVRSGDSGSLGVDDAYYVQPGFYEVTLYFDRRDQATLTITAGFPY
jgi:hypothetical protein